MAMTKRERTLGSAFLFLLLAGEELIGALYMKVWKARVVDSEFVMEWRQSEA